MPDSIKELASTVSLLCMTNKSVTSNKLEDIHSIVEVVDELSLLMNTPNVSAIVIHMSKHPEEELILKDEVIN